MKTTIKKAMLLEAMKTILQEYREERHETSGTTCKLCRLYLNLDTAYRSDSCKNCPMGIFSNNSFACQQRRCRPVDCRKDAIYGKTPKRLKRVVEFYEQAIAYIETADFRKKNVFKPLNQIDLMVAKKYMNTDIDIE
jgi:hypothetical protein